MPFMEIRKAVLATIAYYDGLGFPLTFYEICRFLINPKRLFPKIEGMGEISPGKVAGDLEDLKGRGVICQHLGMYTLAGRESFCAQRLEREKVAAQKWRKFIKKVYWLQMVPWIEGLFASGSLALGNTTKESDFDVLVLVKPGRLYLARVFLSLLTSLMGMRRTRDQRSAPDKFCFNHYITTDQLNINHESLYNAQTYARLVTIWAINNLAAEFFSANIWINKFVYNFKPHQEMVRRNIKESKYLKALANIIETAFDNWLGDLLERIARWYQQKRISNNPMTRAPGGRVIYTDKELEFHPRSFERTILDRYNLSLKRLHISTVSEPDSGLLA